MNQFRIEVVDIKGRKPLLWHPTCTKLSWLLDTLNVIVEEKNDALQIARKSHEDFGSLRTKLINGLSALEDAKARVATFLHKADSTSTENRKLDPESVATQQKIRAGVSSVESTLDSLAEHLENLQLTASPNKHLRSPGKPHSLSPSVIDVRWLYQYAVFSY